MIPDVNAIAAHLTNAGLAGGSTGWPIQKLAAQDEPDQAVVIYATGGAAPEQAVDRAWREPSFQVMVRGVANAGAQSCAAKADAIVTALDRATVNGFAYFRATQSSPIPLGPDEQGRQRFVVNFRAGEA